MDSDEDVPLKSIVKTARAMEATARLAGSRRPRGSQSPTDGSSEPSLEPPAGRKRARAHYALDDLGGGDAEDQDEYDLGSTGSSEDSDTGSSDHNVDQYEKPPASASPSESEGGFNYLAFDVERDRKLDKQVRVCVHHSSHC